MPEELSYDTFPLREKAEEIFILADKDHDGRLSLNELRDIMHRPEMAEAALQNYTKGREDERVTLQEFLEEVLKSYKISAKVAEKMLWIYEKTLTERRRQREEEANAPAEAPAEAATDEAAADSNGNIWSRPRKEGEHDALGEASKKALSLNADETEAESAPPATAEETPLAAEASPAAAETSSPAPAPAAEAEATTEAAPATAQVPDDMPAAAE